LKIVHSRKLKAATASPKIAALLATVSETALREHVERIAVPRHYSIEAEQNRATAAWLGEVFASLGYQVQRQGPYANILALPETKFDQAVLVGAHYDSVPMCPGADDNGSAVAAMLGCAAACSLWRPVLPVVFVAFNREEEGLIGSRNFVQAYLPAAPFRVVCAHVLEMVGFASSVPGSQRVPTGLPVKISDTGDFLGLLANSDSTDAMDFAMRHGRAYVADLPILGLNVKLGLEKFFPVLNRSDHAPFWEEGLPSVMWTDTSEFRNPHYHRDSDTPETLNYGFLRQVTQILTACVVAHAEQLE